MATAVATTGAWALPCPCTVLALSDSMQSRQDGGMPLAYVSTENSGNMTWCNVHAF